MTKELTETKAKRVGTPGHILLQTRDYQLVLRDTVSRGPALLHIILTAQDHRVEKFDS